jgi:pyruvate ferredoxin oxidoreductase gamma subunit
MDPTVIGVVEVEAGIKEEGMIIANYPKDPKELKEELRTPAKVITINATKLAMEELGRPITNTAMVGAFVGATKLIKLETLKDTIAEWFEDRTIAEKNIRLVEAAYKLVEV